MVTDLFNYLVCVKAAQKGHFVLFKTKDAHILQTGSILFIQWRFLYEITCSKVVQILLKRCTFLINIIADVKIKMAFDTPATFAKCYCSLALLKLHFFWRLDCYNIFF